MMVGEGRFNARAAAVAAAVLFATPVRAQWGVWAADSLLAAGRLGQAESAYYAAVRAHPHDPVARAALGRYLGARGAWMIAETLLQEARDFGGDSTAIARSLASLYAQQHQFARLAALKPNVLSTADRRRAQWLATHAGGG